MPEFNRFDICEAYYIYATRYHSGQWSRLYAVLGRLYSMGFRPAPALQKPKHLTRNGCSIYAALIRKKYMQ